MRLIVTINFLGSETQGFMDWGIRVYGLKFDAINFVKRERKETYIFLFFIMKVKTNYDQSIFSQKSMHIKC
jgi:hypothetical protein